MHQFPRTTAMLATAFALSLAGCAAMDFTPEVISEGPELSDTRVKIDGTWWDSKQVKMDDLAAVRKQKLEEDAKLTTPYLTATAAELAKANAPRTVGHAPQPLTPPGALAFRNVLDDGETLPDSLPGSIMNEPAPPLPSTAPIAMTPIAQTPIAQAPMAQPPVTQASIASVPAPPAFVEPVHVQPVAQPMPATRPVTNLPEAERAPPLPTATARVSKPTATLPATATAAPHAAAPRVAAAGVNNQLKARLRGVVRGGRGGLVAMVEVPETGTQMAREGDTLMIAGENGEPQPFQVKHITNHQVVMHSETNQVMVIQ